MDIPKDIYRHLIFNRMSIPDIFNYATTNSHFLWILRDPEFWSQYLRRENINVLLNEIIRVDSPYLYGLFGSLHRSPNVELSQLIQARAFRLLKIYFQIINPHTHYWVLYQIVEALSRYNYSDDDYFRLSRVLSPIVDILSSKDRIYVSDCLFNTKLQTLLLFSRLRLPFRSKLIDKIVSQLEGKQRVSTLEKVYYQELIENLYSTGVEDESLQNLYFMEQYLANK